MAYNHLGLYDTQSENFIIGSLLNLPELVHSEKYVLSVADFFNKRNKIIYGVINNLVVSQGAERITPQDIDSYLMRFPEQYKVYSDNSGINALIAISEIGAPDIKIYESHFNRIKKFAVLRDLEDIGLSTKNFYDPDALWNSKINEEFENLSVNDILSSIKERLNLVEDKNISKNKITSQDAAEGISELITRFKENPEVGEFLSGDIYNYAVRGARYGKLYLTSAASGHGKTRMMVGNAASMAYPFLDSDGNLVMKDKYHKVLYVATEQDPEEIQTLILSHVSGVDEKRLLLGIIDAEEERRLLLAAQIIEKYRGNLILEYISDPSIALVKSKIIKHIFKSDIGIVFYDYIFTSPSLITEFKALREDVVLMMMSNTLKEIAVDYQVFIMSGTQLNGEWEKQVVRNANHIRGAKAIVDKVDVGTISVKLSAEEMSKVTTVIEQLNLEKLPNMVTDIYKNRRGELTGVKIFRYFDYGTCKMQDLFLTDTSYNLLNNYDKLIQRTYTKTAEDFLNEH